MEFIEELKDDQFNKPFLRQFNITEHIGKGGFCQVFKGVRWTDDLPVAIKVMDKET